MICDPFFLLECWAEIRSCDDQMPEDLCIGNPFLSPELPESLSHPGAQVVECFHLALVGAESLDLGLYGFTDVDPGIRIGGSEEIDPVYGMRQQSLSEELREKIPISGSRIN